MVVIVKIQCPFNNPCMNFYVFHMVLSITLFAQVILKNNLKPSLQSPRRSFLATWSVVTTSFTRLCFSIYVITTLFDFLTANISHYARSPKGVHQRTVYCLPWTVILAVQLCTGTLPFPTVSV